MATKKKTPARAEATPPTPAPVAGVAPVANPLSGLIDELGALEGELAPYAQKLARIAALRTLVRGSVASEPAESAPQLAGAEYLALLGPKGKETVIDVAHLVSLIGAEEYAKFATTSLKALLASVKNPLHLALVMRTELTGPRPLRVVRRGVKAPANEAKAA